MKVTEQVAQFAEPVVQAHGCTLWDVEYVREGGEWFLRLYIDKDGGVDISDCEAISRALIRFSTKRIPCRTVIILRSARQDSNGS